MKRARYHSIPIWFDEQTGEMKPRSVFFLQYMWYDLLIDINVWLDVHVFQVEEFPIWMEEK